MYLLHLDNNSRVPRDRARPTNPALGERLGVHLQKANAGEEGPPGRGYRNSRDSDWTPGQNSVKQALGGCIRYSLVPRQAINVMRSVFCPCIYLDRQCTTDFSLVTLSVFWMYISGAAPSRSQAV